MPIELAHNAHLFLNWGDQKQYYITERSKLHLESHNFTWFHNRPFIKSPTMKKEKKEKINYMFFQTHLIYFYFSI